MKHKLTTLLMTALVVVLATAGVSGAQYGGNQGFIINPSQVFAGNSVSFLGTGCEPGSTVTFTIEDLTIQPDSTVVVTRSALALDLGSTNADNTSEGNFFLGNVVIPIGTPPGIYDVTAVCGDTTLTASLTVLALPPTTTPPSLAVTGTSSTIPMAKVAVVLIALGGAILLITGKRRERSAQR